MSNMTSSLRQSLEDILLEPVDRFDRDGRARRVMAAVILECATHGYTDASMAEIAKRAKVSTATLYRDYNDRDDLFIKAIQAALTLLAQVWRPQDLPADPLERLEALLLAHGRAWSDPFLSWLIRMYIHFASSKAPHLLVLGRAARASNMNFWSQELAKLEAEGHLVTGHTQTILAILIGAVERRTIFARLGFGENDTHTPALNDVVSHSALAVFQVFGTAKFWANRDDQRSAGWCGDQPSAFGASEVGQLWSVGVPKRLLDPPSDRLVSYANRVLAQDVNRLDVEGRKVRVQLAAMLECIEHGYEAASMAGVAARAIVSTATLYMDYEDKQRLFIDAMLLQARFRVDYGKLIEPAWPTQDAISSTVFSIAAVLSDPKFIWFHYVSMASELSASPDLIASSRATRDHTEGFWIDYLTRLISEGVLLPCDVHLIMNLLLGATQRRSVLAMVLFGKDDVNEDELADLSRASVEFVLRLVGIRIASA
jgi:AcrR family transcriptional regulator